MPGEGPEQEQQQPQGAEAAVEWEKEIGWEVQRQDYKIFVPNDSAAIQEAVRGAVYKLLSGKEVVVAEVNRFMKDSSSPEAGAYAGGLMASIYAEAEKDGFAVEAEEAEAAATKAVERMQAGREYSVDYDYWRTGPIKSGVKVVPVEGRTDVVMLSSPLESVGNLRGMPQTLMYQEYSSRGAKHGEPPPIESLKRAAALGGLAWEDIVQAEADNQMSMHFSQASGPRDKGQMSEELHAAVWGNHDDLKPDAARAYGLMDAEAQARARASRETGLNFRIPVRLNVDGGEATLELSVWGRGRSWYDAEAGRMRVEFDPQDEHSLYASMRAKLTPETTNAALLALRLKGKQLTNEIGMPGR